MVSLREVLLQRRLLLLLLLERTGVVEIELEGLVEPDERALALGRALTHTRHLLLQLVGLQRVLQLEARAVQGQVVQIHKLAEGLELLDVLGEDSAAELPLAKGLQSVHAEVLGKLGQLHPCLSCEIEGHYNNTHHQVVKEYIEHNGVRFRKGEFDLIALLVAC